MNRITAEKLKIGDVVIITSKNTKNYGKRGIVSEIERDSSGKIYRIYLKPDDCKFEFSRHSLSTLNKEGLHGWTPSLLSLPNKKTKKIEKKNLSLTFKFTGTEEDISKITEDIKAIAMEIAPDAKLTVWKE